MNYIILIIIIASFYDHYIIGWMRGQPKIIKPEKYCTDTASIDLLWKLSEAAVNVEFSIVRLLKCKL